MRTKMTMPVAVTLLVSLGLLLLGSGLCMAGTTVTYMVCGGAPNSEAVLERIPEFEQATGIKVEIVRIPHEQTFPRAVVEAIGKSGVYDVCWIERTMVAPFAENNLLQPLDKYVSAERINQFFEGHLKFGTYGEHVRVLPFANDLRALYYRTDLFAEAGVSRPPDNWDELVDAAVKTNALKERVYGLILAGYKGRGVWILSDFIRQAGGRILDDAGNPAVSEPSAIRGLQFFTDLYRKDKVLPGDTPDYRWEQTRTLYAQGYSAMVYEFNDIIPLLENPETSVVQGKYDLAMLPQDKIRATNNAGFMLGIPVGSRKQEAAGKLVEWICSPEIQKHMAMKSGTLSGNKVAMQMIIDGALPTDDRTDTKSKARWQFYRDIILTTYELPVTSSWPQISDVMARTLTGALAGEFSPKEGLVQAAKEIREIMAGM